MEFCQSEKVGTLIITVHRLCDVANLLEVNMDALDWETHKRAMFQSLTSRWPQHRKNREFGSYFFQTGKTQGIWF